MQNILQRVGGGSVGRLDRVRVYLTGGRCVCMTEPLCDGLQIGSGRNQQGGVCMPKPVQRDGRQVIPLNEIMEPAGQGIRVDGLAVPCGK